MCIVIEDVPSEMNGESCSQDLAAGISSAWRDFEIYALQQFTTAVNRVLFVQFLFVGDKTVHIAPPSSV